MATSTMNSGALRPQTLRRTAFFDGTAVKFSWSSLFAGVIVALATWLLLYALGLALGLSNVNPEQPNSMRGSGIFTGVWSLVTPLVALFVGGLIAGRGVVHNRRAEGVLYGFVVWGLTTLIGFWILMSVFGAVVSTAGKIGESAISGAGRMGAGISSSAISIEQIVRPLNERLLAEGKPSITTDQLRSTVDEIVERVGRGLPLDRELLVGSVARNTALSRSDAEEVATGIENQISRAGDQAQTQAAKVADTTGKIFWGVFGALLLGLVAAMLGGFTGTPKFPSETTTVVTNS